VDFERDVKKDVLYFQVCWSEKQQKNNMFLHTFQEAFLLDLLNRHDASTLAGM